MDFLPICLFLIKGSLERSLSVINLQKKNWEKEICS